jgi:hypothetical protein
MLRRRRFDSGHSAEPSDYGDFVVAIAAKNQL